jgi:hypothetical protein
VNRNRPLKQSDLTHLDSIPIIMDNREGVGRSPLTAFNEWQAILTANTIGGQLSFESSL